ncbi:MAG: cytochrome P460 family protein [Steroidobacteraceae bacterium]
MNKYLWTAALLVATASLAGSGTEVPYPADYRSWRHIKSMVIEEGHPLYSSFGGIHHLYANTKAVAGYRSGHFADGAVIVFDLLDAHEQGGAIVEGDRKVLGVMHRNRARYAATGGWGFEGFAQGARDRRVVADNAAQACFGCHAAQSKTNYLFSAIRD